MPYNVSCYYLNNNYGPYLVGGQIDWIQVEALANVIRMNLMELFGVWVDLCPLVGLEATRAYSMIDTACHSPADWACIEGTWRKIVCFMEYWYVPLASCSILIEAHTNLSVSSDLFGKFTFLFPVPHVDDFFSVEFNVSAFKNL